MTKEQLTDIDLDIYSIMKEIPNNENHNSVYIRWNKETGDTFIRALCNVGDIHNVFGVAMYDKTVDNEFVAASKLAFLNLAIHVLKEQSKQDIDDFFELVKSVTNYQKLQ